MSKPRMRYGLALASAATLACLSCGGVTGAAAADPNGHPNGHANGHAFGHDNGNGTGHGKGHDKAHGKGHSNGHGNGHGNGHPAAPGQQTQHGDPPGNNGTVKIAAPSDAAGHPSNNPHPGCTVVVEWFGFDQGDEVVSTVSFAAQAPTSDAVIGGTSPAQVFVGGDAASGGTDLDGRQAYQLTFQGEPHPKQGFHVKLTVATPHSLGNDTKSKVFWVEPCATSTTAASTPAAADQGGSSPSPLNEQPAEQPARGVLGTSLEAAAESVAAEPVAREDADAPVPTSVDAGEDTSVLPEWAKSPLPFLVVGGGLVLVAAGIARRSRHGA